MIKKIFRLKEKEVKKVLLQKKPFFSYGVVLNYIQNKLLYNRFAIVISSKSVENNVNRVFFRRLFYKLVSNYLDIKFNKNFDMVFVVKKHTKLDKKDFQSITSFENDVKFLFKKINSLKD